VAGAIASADAFNELITDISDEMTASLAVDGRTVWTGDQDAGTNTVTNLAAPVNANDAARKADVDAVAGLSTKLLAIDALDWHPGTAVVGGTFSIMYCTDDDSVAALPFYTFGQNLISATGSAAAHTVLGLGDLASEDTVDDDDWSGTPLAVANGGTGATTVAGAQTNLGITPYTGGDVDNLDFPVGSHLMVNPGSTTPHRNASVSPTLGSAGGQYQIVEGGGGGTPLNGTWRCRGHAGGSLLVQRTG